MSGEAMKVIKTAALSLGLRAREKLLHWRDERTQHLVFVKTAVLDIWFLPD